MGMALFSEGLPFIWGDSGVGLVGSAHSTEAHSQPHAHEGWGQLSGQVQSPSAEPGLQALCTPACDVPARPRCAEGSGEAW